MIGDFHSLPLGSLNSYPRDTIIVSEPGTDPESERFQRRSAAAKKGWQTRRQREFAKTLKAAVDAGTASAPVLRPVRSDDMDDDTPLPTSDAGMWIILILALAVLVWVILHMGLGVV